MDQPNAKACVFIVCGENDEHAEALAISQDIWLMNVEKGLDSQVPDEEEAREKYDDLNKEARGRIEENRRRMIIGGPKESERAAGSLQCTV